MKCFLIGLNNNLCRQIQKIQWDYKIFYLFQEREAYLN